jgi:isocitrate dehydrogenase (NAD+)
VTEKACTRFFEFTFELARVTGRQSVHCVHKANILKQADGLFLECFRNVAKKYPEISVKELIVDNTCMQLVTRPQQFEILAAGNLYGDLLGDLGAGLVGGISATAAINYGTGVKVYEAVYGAPIEQVPSGKGNPLPLILPALALVKDLGFGDAATRIQHAIEKTLVLGDVKPIDLGGTATADEFTDAVVKFL